MSKSVMLLMSCLVFVFVVACLESGGIPLLGGGLPDPPYEEGPEMAMWMMSTGNPGVVDTAQTPLQCRLPLPGGKGWLLTMGLGGEDCFDPGNGETHQGNNYYSLDFGRWSRQNGKIKEEKGVPVYAAHDGVVIQVGEDEFAKNGYFVEIERRWWGPFTENYSTIYLHLKERAWVNVGDEVTLGTRIGTMGDTGLTEGVHLHFGVRYAGKGSSDVLQLARVKMEGRFLSEYVTRCDEAGNRVGYYQSYNWR